MSYFRAAYPPSSVPINPNMYKTVVTNIVGGDEQQVQMLGTTKQISTMILQVCKNSYPFVTDLQVNISREDKTPSFHRFPFLLRRMQDLLTSR